MGEVLGGWGGGWLVLGYVMMNGCLGRYMVWRMVVIEIDVKIVEERR